MSGTDSAEGRFKFSFKSFLEKNVMHAWLRIFELLGLFLKIHKLSLNTKCELKLLTIRLFDISYLKWTFVLIWQPFFKGANVGLMVSASVCLHLGTVCPGSSDLFHIVTYNLTTSWTHSNISTMLMTKLLNFFFK